MDAHTLAHKLLAGPNVPVYVHQYNGGEDVPREVQGVDPDHEDAPFGVVLTMYPVEG